MMKKADRQKVFEKFGGRCAYCGCELTNGWHVDHIEPVVRKQRFIKGYYKHIATGRKMTTAEIASIPESEDFINTYKWVHDHWAADGLRRPENDVITNNNPACASCNIQKHSQSLEDFRNQIEQFVESLNKYHSIYRFAKRYGLVQETGKPVVFYFETVKTP